MPRNLILAYVVVWIIHGCYLAILFAKKRRLDREEREG